MSRDIEFRAKNANGEWVYGFVAMVSICENIHWWKIFNFDNGAVGTPIDPKTLGQYTGIKDKNGSKIYEGDLVSTDLDRKFNIVSYKAGGFVFECSDGGEEYLDRMLQVWSDEDVDKYGEVIGNIHDNHELLEK